MLDLAVAVRVRVEMPAVPAQQQAHRQEHDHQTHERLGAVLHRVRQVRAEQDDRQPEQRQRDRMAEPPGHAEPPRPARAVLGIGRDQRRDRGQVIGVGRVPQAQHQRDHQHQRQRLAAGQLRYPLVKPEHPDVPPPRRAAPPPRRAARRRCRRRSAAAARAPAPAGPPSSSSADVRSSSRRFWNTPPDSTTVPTSPPAAPAARRRRPSPARPRCGSGRPRPGPSARRHVAASAADGGRASITSGARPSSATGSE